MALFSGIFNIGIGAGALVGNQVSLHWSMSMIGYGRGACLCRVNMVNHHFPPLASDTRRTDAIAERPIWAF